MRVIGGEAKSLRLLVPKGASLRPTADVVRQALFSSLGPRLPGARFLDVYAGTGAVGIEALSRGAAFCAFIERDRRCVKAIRINLENTGFAVKAAVVAGDAERVIKRVLAQYGPFDIVFLDPPYADVAAVRVVESVVSEAKEPMLVIFQHSKNAVLDRLGRPDRVRAFGETMLSWYEVRSEGRDEDAAPAG